MDIEFFQSIYAHPLITLSQYERIAQAHTKVTVKKGNLFQKANATANNYSCLASGVARKYVFSEAGDEITTNFASQGEFAIVIASFFQRSPSLEYVVAATDVIAYQIDFDAFQALFNEIEGFREWGRNWMAGELFASEQRAIQLITMSATERYQQLAAKHQDLVQQVPLMHLASYLGIADTSLSRIRKTLAS